MLQPDRMLHIEILAKREDKERVIDLLAEAKAVHLESHRKVRVSETDVDIGTPLPSAEELSDALTKVKNLLSKLKAEEVPGLGAGSLRERLARIDALAAKYSAHEERLAEHERRLDTTNQQQHLLGMLHGLEGPIDAIFKTKSVESILFKRTNQSSQDAIGKLKPIGALSGREGGLIVVRREQAEEARSALKAAGFMLADPAPLRELKGTVAQAQEHLRKEQREAQLALEEERTFSETFQEHAPFLKQSARALTLELMKAQAPLRFGTTRQAILIRGFIPAREAGGFRKQLEAAEIEAVVDLTEAREAPTKLRNPPTLNNFEELIKLYTLPKYNEIDPTSIMAITFPIFFGFMLGDIGYGFLLLIIFTFLRATKPALKRFADIVIVSAISTVIFGWLYGEIFGGEHFLGIELHPILHRTGDFNHMFMIALGIGIAHLTLGLILGLINEAHHEGWWHAILKKGSWIVLLAGSIMLAGAYGLLHEVPVLGELHINPLVAYVTLGIAVLGVLAGEKLQGLFELPGIYGNILSYTRLVAIGLSSVYLALVVNDLGGGLVDRGGVWLALGILVIVFGHALNLALGLLGPFLHSLRLHYAEFFMKFYAGGGKQYQPFGVIE